MSYGFVLYKNLWVLNPAPIGDAGIKINTNFQVIADALEALGQNTGLQQELDDLSNDLASAVSDAQTTRTLYDAHTADTDNPHSTTAAQVGAYTSGQTDSLLNNKANASTVQSHLANTANPHSVTAAQVGAIAVSVPVARTDQNADFGTHTIASGPITVNVGASNYGYLVFGTGYPGYTATNGLYSVSFFTGVGTAFLDSFFNGSQAPITVRASAFNCAGSVSASGSISSSQGVSGASGTFSGDVSGADFKGIIETIGVTVDGNGTIISTGNKGFRYIDHNYQILDWSIVTDQVGNIVFDLGTCTFANYPTVSSIVAAAPPTVTSAQKATSSTLTGWTTTLAGGSYIKFTVNSAASVTRATLSIRVKRV